MPTRAILAGVEYYLPVNVVDNHQLAREFPEWSPEKITQKTGIRERHVASPGELSSDLAEAAARKLFLTHQRSVDSIDFLIFCTQTPDYRLPTTACLLQDRLQLRRDIGAIDYNLGCSGYVYGLFLAKGLIESKQARAVLLLTGETYSKLINRNDKVLRSIFGDAGSASLLLGVSSDAGESISACSFGTDGAGGAHLMCARDGWRSMASTEDPLNQDLWMNGPEVFTFSLRVVPEIVHACLKKAGLTMDQIDLFVFHQANQYMLEHLREHLKIPQCKFMLALQNCGNTVSSSIPIALRDAQSAKRLKHGDRILLVGFGVGFSWGATVVTWWGDIETYSNA